ncbi:thiol reductant ABC exporter subunit CydD [Acetobacter sp.]|jgi:ATP-binding cassette subfamily C protein CydD|uniref:thiol reductant ABC exporter subunit CydD n=1 Tax=Acetobacter sp. TaxID=440 RepID=UPI0025C6B39C|nr:thiol reductant ABC exporter subunit CydD [Acetobacter sp.]MCH4091986.1 thiol reductant ABC exporter subunit CydD [Acetobacter sp.]MCI1301094.1 thiol reductant ABC exporter subunit CydD [Acetobacter sp.]MCI1317287.1 thiol reductant ABC exporter subunit CydD [Acetobacter sp.]
MQTEQGQAGHGTLKGLASRAGLWLGVAVSLNAASAAFLVLQLLAFGGIVDDLTFRGRGLHDEAGHLGWLALLLTGRAVLVWLADMASATAGMKVTTALRSDVLSHLLRTDSVRLAHRGAGETVTTMVTGIDALEPYIAQYLPRAAMMAILPLMILACIAGLDGWSLLILACTGPLIPLFMALVGYRAQAIMDRQWTRLLLLGSGFLDFVQGLTTLRLFGHARQAVDVVATMADDYRRSTLSVMRVAFLTSATLEFFASLSIALIAVVFGSRLLAGHADFRTAFLVLLLAPEYFMPLRAFSASYHARQNATVAMERITSLMALPELPKKVRTPEDEVRSISCLVCDDLSAGYDDAGTAVLTHVSCRFARDELTVVVGESGAGKTTLMRTLLGLHVPAAGRVVALDDQGQEVESVWPRMGWVPQRPCLPYGTIAEILRLGAPDADMDCLRAVAAEADALSFIEALPCGFDTVIGERGARLSGGQVRRLALARALIREPDILLLDEPTAGLDPDSEQRVMDAIRRCVEGRIVIVSTHRQVLMKGADRLLAVEGGTIRAVSCEERVAA